MENLALDQRANQFIVEQGVTVNEGDTATVRVRRIGNTSLPYRIEYRHHGPDSTAIYLARDGALDVDPLIGFDSYVYFEPGQTEASMEVSTRSDFAFEGPEQLGLIFLAPSFQWRDRWYRVARDSNPYGNDDPNGWERSPVTINDVAPDQPQPFDDWITDQPAPVVTPEPTPEPAPTPEPIVIEKIVEVEVEKVVEVEKIVEVQVPVPTPAPVTVNQTIDNSVTNTITVTGDGNVIAAGPDVVVGGDQITGMVGRDRLRGTAGEDVFTIQGDGKDKITRFNPEQDTLQLDRDLMGGIGFEFFHVVTSKKALRAHKNVYESELIYFENKNRLYLDDTPGDKGWGKDGGLIAKVADLEPAAVEVV